MSHDAASKSFFSRFFLHPARFLIRRYRARRQLAEMLSLSDAVLCDIGLTRFDIIEAMRSNGELASTNPLSRVITAPGTATLVAARVSGSVSEAYLKAA